eukprot:6214345-Pleurochrysis_carterae.AAC.1
MAFLQRAHEFQQVFPSSVVSYLVRVGQQKLFTPRRQRREARSDVREHRREQYLLAPSCICLAPRVLKKYLVEAAAARPEGVCDRASAGRIALPDRSCDGVQLQSTL